MGHHRHGIAAKASGEYFAADGFPENMDRISDAFYDEGRIRAFADHLAESRRGSHDPLALVMGGGNIWRGRSSTLEHVGVRKVTADTIGMLATTINALTMRDVLRAQDIPVEAFGRLGGIDISHLAASQSETMLRDMGPDLCNVKVALKFGSIALIGGGTAISGQTTDTAVVEYARDLGMRSVVKMTDIGHLYDSDPRTNPEAEPLYDLPVQEAIERGLGALDMSAMILAHNVGLDIVICHPDDFVPVLAGDIPHDRSTILRA